MDGANWNPGDGHAGKDVTADLEGPHGEGCVEDCARGGTEPGEADEGGHEDGAVGCDEEELDKGEGDGVTKVVHDGLSGVGGHGGGGVPDGTLDDEAEGGDGRAGRRVPECGRRPFRMYAAHGGGGEGAWLSAADWPLAEPDTPAKRNGRCRTRLVQPLW